MRQTPEQARASRLRAAVQVGMDSRGIRSWKRLAELLGVSERTIYRFKAEGFPALPSKKITKLAKIANLTKEAVCDGLGIE